MSNVRERAGGRNRGRPARYSKEVVNAALTPAVEERFAEEYIVDLNASAAYRRLREAKAVSGKYPSTAAYQLMLRPTVRERIAALERERANRVELNADRLLAELCRLGFSNMADYMQLEPDGGARLDFSAVDRSKAAAIQELTVEQFMTGGGEYAQEVRRVKFKLADKARALELLGKHLKLFVDRTEVSGPGGVPFAPVLNIRFVSPQSKP
jgi:phage terminase small subunit